MLHDRIIIFTVRMLIMSDYITGDIRVDLGHSPRGAHAIKNTLWQLTVRGLRQNAAVDMSLSLPS